MMLLRLLLRNNLRMSKFAATWYTLDWVIVTVNFSALNSIVSLHSSDEKTLKPLKTGLGILTATSSRMRS